MHRHLQRIGRYALEQQNAQQRARCQIERSVRLGPEVPIPLVVAHVNARASTVARCTGTS